MKLVFFLRHQGYLRNFESAVRELAARGHEVHLALDSTKTSWLDTATIERLVATVPGVTTGPSPPIARKRSVLFDRGVRHSLDYLRYFERPFRDAHGLRRRAGRRVPAVVRSFPGLRAAAVRRPLAAVLRGLLRLVPPVPAVDEYLAAHQADAVLVTPLVALGSPQVEYVRAARRVGIPSLHCVASWDNLTNKGLIHELPDAVLVWNDAQRAEAVELHGVPPERVHITGAQCYDHWFGRAPSRTREQFAGAVGLDPARAIVLYVCSSPFVAPDEVAFVRRWLEALRAAGPPLADAGVVVRPHPQNAEQWDGVELGTQGAVVWPRGGDDPVDDAARADYFDSMHHADAVVGVNTSAMIESAILGRPVHSVLAPEFAETQAGTLHFAHVAGPEGMAHVAGSLDEHARSLAASVATVDGRRNAAFVERFVRPCGVDRPATEAFADAVEAILA